MCAWGEELGGGARQRLLWHSWVNGPAPPAAQRVLSLQACLVCQPPTPASLFSPPPPLQVVEFPDASGPLEFSYDEEWLAVLKATHPLMNLQRRPWPMPAQTPPPSQEQLEDVRRRLEERQGGWVGGLGAGQGAGGRAGGLARPGKA